MWRAFFLSIGVFLVIVGVECLAVEKVSLKFHEPPPPIATPFDTQAEKGPRKNLNPPPWAPWSLMSSGIVVCLYSFTLPRRVKG
jgi:hypothetical protein